MKPMDDKKTVEQNVKLEEELKKEREEWKDKVIELINMMKDNKKLSEAQVFQLSYRQQVQERINLRKVVRQDLVKECQISLQLQSFRLTEPTGAFRDRVHAHPVCRGKEVLEREITVRTTIRPLRYIRHQTAAYPLFRGGW